MSAFIAAAIAATALGHAEPAAPAPEAARPRIITNPDWVAKPTGDDLARYYPAAAIQVGVSGSATIKCLVTREGGLTGCAVLAESPAGWHFGEATVRVAAGFRMRPKTVDGVPVAGAKVVVPIRWMMPPDDQPAAEPVEIRPGDLDGDWTGAIGEGPARLEFAFHIRGGRPSTVDSPTLGVSGVRLAPVAYAGAKVLVETDAAGGERIGFAGGLGEAGVLDGWLIRSGDLLPLTLTRVSRGEGGRK